MPRLKPETAQQRREAITRAAFGCFARNGFAGTSMADIIAESGMSAGSIYSHFASKAELIREVATDRLSLGLSSLDAAAKSVEPVTPGALAALAFDTLRGFIADAPLLLQIWAEAHRDPDLAALAHENIMRIRAGIRAALLPWAAEVAGEPGADVLASRRADAVISMLQGALVRLSITPDVDADALRDSIRDAL